MHMKPEGRRQPGCLLEETHTSCCLCWPNKCIGVGLGLHSGPLLQISCTSTTSLYQLGIYQEVILSMNIHQNKNNFVPALRIGWERMYSHNICNFSFPCNGTIEHHRNVIGKDVWRLLLCPTQNRSGSTKTRSTMALIRRVLKIS